MIITLSENEWMSLSHKSFKTFFFSYTPAHNDDVRDLKE